MPAPLACWLRLCTAAALACLSAGNALPLHTAAQVEEQLLQEMLKRAEQEEEQQQEGKQQPEQQQQQAASQ